VITERQLETWASQGQIGQFTDTYNRIRNSLADAVAPYRLNDVDIFLQGSYKNDTNVHGDSDVDVVLCHAGSFYKDLTRLSPDDQRAFDAAPRGIAAYNYAQFKQEAGAYIRRLYDNVRVGRKAMHVPGGNSGRRNADILLAFQFRRYYEFKSWNNQRYSEGVCFISDDGSIVENFPKLHSANCTAKHQDTGGYFKPMVRIFKNMRNRMIEDNRITVGSAPSYFIEGMLSNVPTLAFGETYQQTWINCYNHLAATDQEQLVCGNHMHWLVRDGSSTSWPVADFNAFLAALRNFWEN
jgi:hypothetical protein